MLFTSNFSLSHNVFHLRKNKYYHFHCDRNKSMQSDPNLGPVPRIAVTLYYTVQTFKDPQMEAFGKQIQIPISKYKFQF